jgi:hypothetical protein
MLTNAQLQTLKAAIIADGALNAQPNNSDGNFAIAVAMNQKASPDFTVWKTNVSIGEIGKKFNGTELAGLTTGNQSRLQTIAAFLSAGVNPSLIDNRAFFDDIFSGAGGTNTRANLLALWKRFATRIEKLFATGTGSDVSPATLTFEGTLSYQDVQTARDLP